MEPRDLFAAIQSLLKPLQEYRAKGTAHFDQNLQDTLKKVYAHIFPHVQLQLSCSACTVHALTVCESFYEREYPKWLEASMKQESEKRKATRKAK